MPPQDAASRFEYRVFADDLGELRDHLIAQMDESGVEASEHVYLLGRRLDRNVKARGGSIEIKALRGVRGRLERWEPAERADLPVTAAWIRGPLSEELGVPALGAALASYDLDGLLRLVASEPALHAVRVHKERQRFEREGLLAEFCRIGGPARVESAAVEGADPAEVEAAVRRLGLDRWPNTSYVRWLERYARDL